jgi:hypothetical protein
MKRSDCRDGSSYFLIELNRHFQNVILHRGRLLLAGRRIPVEQLPDVQSDSSRAWIRVKASMLSSKFSSIHPWDKAHSLAVSIRGELGRLPYVEPEHHNGQIGRFRDLLQTGKDVKDKRGSNGYADFAELPDDINGFSSHNFERIIEPPNPLRDIPELAFSDNKFENRISTEPENFSSAKLGSSEPQMTHEPPCMLPSSNRFPKPTQKGQSKNGRIMRKRFVFPLIYEMQGWQSYDAAIQQMLEVELVQVYRNAQLRAQFPYLESVTIPDIPKTDAQEIITQLFRSSTSKTLRQFYEKHQNHDRQMFASR